MNYSTDLKNMVIIFRLHKLDETEDQVTQGVKVLTLE